MGYKHMEHSADFREWLGERLTPERFSHSLAVAERAAFLAELYGEDRDKAALAGLLHDCCQCLKNGEQLKIMNSHGIILNTFILAQPQLWHAVAGSIVIQDELGIDDADIISAVRLHTTGGKDMTTFEQIIYIADLTSDDRDYPGSDEYRVLSEKSLERCMLKNLGFTIQTLVDKNLPIVNDAWEAYNYFWNLINERD